MSELVEMLREQASHFTPHERVMMQWDMWRSQIAKGSKSSFPRDCFEALIDGVPEALDDAANEIERQIKLIDELVEALDRQCDNMAFVLNRVDLHARHGKFDSELTADRLVLSKAQSHQTHKPNEGQ